MEYDKNNIVGDNNKIYISIYDKCNDKYPDMIKISDDHFVACYLHTFEEGKKED